MKNLKKIKNIYSVFAVCLMVLGAVLVVLPTLEADVFCKLCGALLLLFGIVKLFGYFSKDLLQLAFQFDFAMGIISCLIGFGMLFWSAQLMEVLIIGIGLFMLIDALLRIQTALDAQKIGVEKWWLIMVVAMITAAIGTLLFLTSYQRTEAGVMLIGLNLIIDGILNLIVAQSTVNTVRRKNEWEV